MINITIDGVNYQIKEGKNLLEACLSLGLDLPYFCYHPAMGSVGACRQCAVLKYKNADDKKGRITMACMEPVADGMIISVNAPEARNFRKSITESLMLNHPHDCPVCDEGGECHLQDMTLMTGHNYRRSDKKKRTYKNQYLGPFINHEMNRCIQCYRCVRFYKDYAGGKDFDVFSSHDHVYFGRHEEGMLESEFSGNLVEVCPTGVFTDKTLRAQYTRKWDLTNSPSVCMNCSVGCNIILSERYGTIRRVMSRYNGSVNGYFICDRGRFGYGFVNSDQRIRNILIKDRETGNQVSSTREQALGKINEMFSSGKRIIGIGSPRSSLEANYFLMKLVGTSSFYHGVSKSDHEILKKGLTILKSGKVHSPSLKEIEKADFVLIIGEDVQTTAPMLGLSLRQTAISVPVQDAAKAGIPQWQDQAVRTYIQDSKTPFFIIHDKQSKLDEVATEIIREDPVRVVTDLIKAISDKEKENKIATALAAAKNPLIITGVSHGRKEIIDTIESLVSSLPDKRPMFAFVPEHCNSTGLSMMDGNSWMDFDTNEDFIAVILENELPDDDNAGEFLQKCSGLIVLDHTSGRTTSVADMVLPCGTPAESDGTFVNYEGRAQRFYKALPPSETIPENREWLREMMVLQGMLEYSAINTHADVFSRMITDIPSFGRLKDHNPETDYRMLNEKISRQTPRFSGRTAINANRTVHEPKPPRDPDSRLAFTMEGTQQEPPSGMVPFYWVPGWNSNNSMNFYLDEPNGHMKGGDPGIRLLE